ncbi:phytanoyl-CoA dioxygenase family protein [Actinoallomurus vinaceus]|uniref:Phytanoyl-CoA dioxygenase family protein n=1 Tax=Actinoallomurus vinaceus TaxID=1080074 RepID=A0ABP8UBP1_9ACTN
MGVDVDAFVSDGFVVLRGAFDAATAAACREVIWAELSGQGIRRDDRRTWTRPVVWADCRDAAPMVAAAASPALLEACDLLIGPSRWTAPVPAVGGPVRFPAEVYPGEVGYHIEGNRWIGEEYWTDVRSRGRGLTAFFLYSDVGPDDAPTRLIAGSHLFIPPILAAAGETGMAGSGAADRLRPSVLCRTTVHCTGRAGDIYLCHPFMVHTATWPHRGRGPRMISQPGIAVPDGFAIDGSDPSPVAAAIVRGLNGMN